MSCGTAGEELPTLHDDIGIKGVKLETIANAAGHFGRYQSRARAEKRVVDHLAGPAVVDDRAPHAFDRLLRAVAPGVLVLRVTKRVVTGNLPDRRLPAVARPVAAFASAHRVPAGLVLPVVIAAAQYEMLFKPTDLRA